MQRLNWATPTTMAGRGIASRVPGCKRGSEARTGQEKTDLQAMTETVQHPFADEGADPEHPFCCWSSHPQPAKSTYSISHCLNVSKQVQATDGCDVAFCAKSGHLSHQVQGCLRIRRSSNLLAHKD